MTFRYQMEKAGMADTRVGAIDDALCALHRAMCQLDTYNMSVMREQFPEVLEAARLWVRDEPMLNKLRD